MSTTTRSSLLLVCSLAQLVGCSAQTVALRSPERFTVAEVRRLGWDDRCGLQKFFEQEPPPNRELLVRTSAELLGPQADTQRGQITYEVSDPQQRQMLRALVSRLYGKVQAIENASRLEVTVDFYTYCRKPRMLVDSSITVRAAGQQVRLAYHPCVGELLLNGDIYRARPTLIAGTR